ncbi:MAG: DNA-binding domain-containing protein [bacterium]
MPDAGWNLDRTERLLWRLITAPEGVAKGLVAEGDPHGALLAEVLEGDPRLSAVEHLDIYANMYFARLIDVLRKDFPVVERALGPVHFHNLVTDFLLAHPPSHYSLRYLGAPFPSYLRDHALARERPGLGDLAAFEWALVDVFDDGDAATIDATELQGIAADDWPCLVLEPIAALRVLDLDAAVQATWLAAQDADACDHDAHAADHVHDAPAELPPPRPGGQAMRIWRREHEVLHREIDGVERRALDALRDRRTFAELCEIVGALVGADEAPASAATLLATWLADGLVASARVAPAALETAG